MAVKVYLFFVCIFFIGLIGLSAVSGFCFQQFQVIKENKSAEIYKCKRRLHSVSGTDLDECCNINGSVGFSSFKNGKFCKVCELALQVQVEENEQNITSTTHWSQWSHWSSCDDCEIYYYQNRTRDCPIQLNMKENVNCSGDSIEFHNCTSEEECMKDGQWGDWQPFSSCSKTCGSDAIRTRNRTCDNPPAQNGGLNCTGNPEEIQRCKLSPCPIDGNWGSWLAWTGCSKTCGNATIVRRRKCDDPKPQHNGKQCSKDIEGDVIKLPCFLSECVATLHWSQWSHWSACGDCEKYNYQKRKRVCPIRHNMKENVNCNGRSVEFHDCTSREECMKDGDDEDVENGSGSSDNNPECTGDSCDDSEDSDNSDYVISFSSLVVTTQQPRQNMCKSTNPSDTEIEDTAETLLSFSADSNSDQENDEWIDCTTTASPAL